VCYTVLIDGCVRNRQLDRAWALLAEMRGAGIKPDAVTFSILMRGCAKTKQSEKAFNLWEEMEDYSIPPTKVTYNAMIEAFGVRPDMYNKAVEFFNRMEAEGFVRDAFSYIAIQRACASVGDIQFLDKVLTEMELSGISRSHASYTLQLKTLVKCAQEPGRKDVKLQNECVKRGIAFVEHVIAADLLCKEKLDLVMALYTTSNKIQRSLELVDKYQEHGLTIDPKGCRLVLDMLARNRRIVETMQFIEKMEDLGVSPDNQCWKLVLKCAMRCRSLKYVSAALHLLDTKGVTLSAAQSDQAFKVIERLQTCAPLSS